ncbi:MAG: CPBP family intramembrane glutamic endopeptidase [Solirubrobacterales bacterium]
MASFPYANWGPFSAVGGVLLALVVGLALAIPVAIVAHKNNKELTATGTVVAQLMAELAFLSVPMLIAARRGASFHEVLRRLGLRKFRPSAGLWMLAALFAYLGFAIVYSAVFGHPEQENIAEKLGAVPLQILVIVFAAPISEEACFRGFLFGGLRTRLPRLAAALVSGVIFGALHATTGLSVVPPLIAFGFILALLYERTGSIIPGILLHMLNNSVALLGQ